VHSICRLQIILSLMSIIYISQVPALPGLVAEVLKKVCICAYHVLSFHLISHTILYKVHSCTLSNTITAKRIGRGEIDELVEYVDKIVQVFTDIAVESGYIDGSKDTIPYVHVKIAVMTTDGCRYWHQDCVPFRLLSTLNGPCTEYVLPQHSRVTLENRQNNSKHAKPMI